MGAVGVIGVETGAHAELSLEVAATRFKMGDDAEHSARATVNICNAMSARYGRKRVSSATARLLSLEVTIVVTVCTASARPR